MKQQTNIKDKPAQRMMYALLNPLFYLWMGASLGLLLLLLNYPYRWIAILATALAIPVAYVNKNWLTRSKTTNGVIQLEEDFVP